MIDEHPGSNWLFLIESYLSADGSRNTCRGKAVELNIFTKYLEKNKTKKCKPLLAPMKLENPVCISKQCGKSVVFPALDSHKAVVLWFLPEAFVRPKTLDLNTPLRGTGVQ